MLNLVKCVVDICNFIRLRSEKIIMTTPKVQNDCVKSFVIIL